MNEDMNNNNVTNNEIEVNLVEEPMSPNKKHKKVRSHKLPRWMSYFLAIALIVGSGFGAGYGTANIVQGFGQEKNGLVDTGVQSGVTPVVLSSKVSGEYDSPVTAIAQAAGPSIVTVISVIDQVAPGFFSNQVFESEGTGSGVIYKITNDGALIITNNHVIQNAKSVSVILNTGVTLAGEVVGFDTRNDLALVKISEEELDKNDVKELTPAVFGDSKNILPGELAVAIGNPMGKEFSQTVTVGVISAVNRELDINNTKLNVIQTDAAINPGNSGGGLFNKNGEIIGINTAKLVNSSVEGMGFAIPIHIALPIIEKIENTGNGENIAYIMEDNRAYLGILMGQAESAGMNFGVIVKDVVEEGPADQAELKAGDIIVALNGTKVTDSAMLYDALSALVPGDEINLQVFRDQQFLDMNVTLGRYGDYKEQQQ